MKWLFNTLIIIFVLVSLYIVRDDLLLAYNKAESYVRTHTVVSAYPYVVPKSGSNGVNIILKGTDTLVPQKSVQTPGPLKVVDELLSINESNLSQKGTIEWTNKNRADAGLPALTENKMLDQSAEKKVDDMFKNQYFEHISPSGKGVSDLAGEVQYEYIVIGENLALGNFKDDEALLTAWMNSPGHRANILNKRYTDIGVSVKKGTYQGKILWLAVQHFGLPKSACPAIDSVLKASVDAQEAKAQAMSSDLTNRRGYIDSGAVYDGMSHNEQIDAYNQLVQTYNALISKIKENISIYNSEVRTFNTCATGN